jgi:hypothetical protein
MPTTTSGRQLAAELGIGESTVREYLKRPDFPVRTSPPWSSAEVAKIRAWRQTLQEDRAGDGKADPSSTAVNTGYKLERMLLTRAQRKKLEGFLIERRLLDAALEGLTKLFVQSLDDMERALPTELAGKDPGEIERLLRLRFRATRESLAGRKLLELEAIDQAVKAAAQPKARGRPGGRR